ncbi:hypothetical protein K438DRAFT_1798406 [Mycena galopus ATCC 62051]|nr:hypothetical protein K438DRAFT_1798406 [Mycena galopus ATCC 62051]
MASDTGYSLGRCRPHIFNACHGCFESIFVSIIMSLLAGSSTDVLDAQDAPWPVYDLPAASHVFAQTPSVILVLGAPTGHALSPILRSPTFARTLLLLVTHAPPPRSALISALATSGSHGAIRILRLRAPLVPGVPAFALSLIDVLDAAAAVAREWRATPDPEPILQLAQAPDGPAFCVSEPLLDFVPLMNRSPLPPSALSETRASALSNTASLIASTSLVSRRARADSKTLFGRVPNDPARPFDALISFLPPNQQENAVLRNVVLVTTLAAGFLAGPAHGYECSADQMESFSTSGTAADSNDGSEPSRSAASTPHPSSRDSSPLLERASRGFHWRSQSNSLSTFNSENPSPDPRPAKKRAFSPFRSGRRRSKSQANLRRSVYEEETHTAASTSSTDVTSPGTRAHFVHVLPASYRNPMLVRALSTFLAAFSTGASTMPPDRAKAYVLSERAMGEALESVLVGALEVPRAVRGLGARAGKEREEEERGAWVAAVTAARPESQASEESSSSSSSNAAAGAEGQDGRHGYGQSHGHPKPPPSAYGHERTRSDAFAGQPLPALPSVTPGVTPTHTRSSSNEAYGNRPVGQPSMTPRSMSALGHTRVPSNGSAPPPTAYAGGVRPILLPAAPTYPAPPAPERAPTPSPRPAQGHGRAQSDPYAGHPLPALPSMITSGGTQTHARPLSSNEGYRYVSGPVRRSSLASRSRSTMGHTRGASNSGAPPTAFPRAARTLTYGSQPMNAAQAQLQSTPTPRMAAHGHARVPSNGVAPYAAGVRRAASSAELTNGATSPRMRAALQVRVFDTPASGARVGRPLRPASTADAEERGRGRSPSRGEGETENEKPQSQSRTRGRGRKLLFFGKGAGVDDAMHVVVPPGRWSAADTLDVVDVDVDVEALGGGFVALPPPASHSYSTTRALERGKSSPDLREFPGLGGLYDEKVSHEDNEKGRKRWLFWGR